MRNFLQEVLIVATGLLQAAAVQQHCRHETSSRDHALTGHVIRATVGIDADSCILRCEKEPLCLSTNYITTWRACELSSRSKDTNPRSLIPKPGVLYISNLFRRSHACVMDVEPCLHGTCVLTDKSPGHACQCQAGFTGDTCERCNPGLPLGVEDGRIPDSALTASTSDPCCPPQGARLRGSSGWVGASIDTANPHFEIDFRVSYNISGILTQGWSHGTDYWTEEYFISYEAGKTLTEYIEGGNRKVSEKDHSHMQGEYMKSLVEISCNYHRYSLGTQIRIRYRLTPSGRLLAREGFGFFLPNG